MTEEQFKKKAEGALRRANRRAVLTIEWIRARNVTFPTGVDGWTGAIRVSAPGFKTATMFATGDNSYVRVD